MIKRIGLLVFAILIPAVLIYGCSSKIDKSKLSDLGGVYSVAEDEIDFSMELSGRLSEGGAENQPIFEMPAISTESGGYSNKMVGWGISRRPEGQTPAADPGAPQLISKYGGLYLGDTSSKVIYLTFDEGYENGYTPKILDALKEKNAKGIFFITGPYLNEHEDLVRRMINEGHTVGNHTIHHPSLPGLSDRELEEDILGLSRVFKEKFGKEMVFLRPPKGEYSERTLALTQKLGYKNMFWSFAYDDWYRDRVRGADYAYNKVMENLHNGAILLLHAVSKDNAEALGSIIDGARAKGYIIGDPRSLI